MKKIPIIKKKDLLKYYKERAKLDEHQEETSELIKEARENKNKEVDYVNDKKEKVKVKEQQLWVEANLLGRKSRAGKYLSKMYPEMSRMSDEDEKMVKKIKKLEVEIFGFDFSKVTFPNLIVMIRSLIRFEIRKWALAVSILALAAILITLIK